MRDPDSDDPTADALHSIASALRYPGTADAATPMGATEVLCNAIDEAAQRIADALQAVAAALELIAESIPDNE